MPTGRRNGAPSKSPRLPKPNPPHPPPSSLPTLTIQAPPQPLPTPSLTTPHINASYRISRGETGVLTFEPYKSLLLPYWRFRTPTIARSSAAALYAIFESYVRRRDFVGADMSRKFVQMGMTRAKRYANHRGGRKYAGSTAVGEGAKKGGGGGARWGGEEEEGGGGDDDDGGESGEESKVVGVKIEVDGAGVGKGKRKGKVEIEKWVPVDEAERKARQDKWEASEIFKGYWRRCIEHEGYQELKQEWTEKRKADDRGKKKKKEVKKEEEE